MAKTESLGQLLAQIIPKNVGRQIAADRKSRRPTTELSLSEMLAEPSVAPSGYLLRLVEMPTLETLMETLEQLRVEPVPPRQREDRESKIAWLEGQIERAHHRERLQAERPDSCWCLGIGGKFLRTTSNVPGVFAPEQYFDMHCPCPDGQARERADREMLEEWRELSLAAHHRVLVGASGLGARYSDATFESYFAKVKKLLGGVPDENLDLVDDLREWIAGESDWLYIWGPLGTGKSAFLSIVARERLLRNPDMRLITAPEILERIQATFGERSEGEPTTAEVTSVFRTCSLLLLDDLGKEYGTPWARSELWKLLNRRYSDRLQTVISSNLSDDELKAAFDPGIADRIFEDCLVLEDAGPNLR